MSIYRYLGAAAAIMAMSAPDLPPPPNSWRAPPTPKAKPTRAHKGSKAAKKASRRKKS